MDYDIFDEPKKTNAVFTALQKIKSKRDDKKDDKKDSALSRIYKNYPALRALGKIALKADTTFTKDKTGAGSIEYFSPKQDTIAYDTGYKYGHPQKGKHGIVYNPQSNTEQDIALDMLHGMRTDKTYDKYRGEFANAIVGSRFGEDLKREWVDYNEETEGKNDGFEQFKDNWVDGVIRNLMFEGTPEDFEKANYWQDAREVYLSEQSLKEKFAKLRGYIKSNKK